MTRNIVYPRLDFDPPTPIHVGDHSDFDPSEIAMFHRGWRAEDYKKERFDGKYPCPICGLKYSAKPRADGCCASLVPQNEGRRGRKAARR